MSALPANDLEIALPDIHLAPRSVAGKSVLASVACRRIDTSSWKARESMRNPLLSSQQAFGCVV